MLGAGGAARAVVFGLIERGFKTIHLVNRTLPRAEELARQFGASVRPAAWDRVATLLPRAALLVNTTSLGMKGQPPLEIDLKPAARERRPSATSSTFRSTRRLLRPPRRAD